MPEDSTQVIGVIGLCDFDDLEEFRHLGPWICAFIVREDLRGVGIGRQIISEIEHLAISYGIETVYLWTEDQMEFYLKLGYGKFDELKKLNRHIHVMRKDLI
jgi:N-acetylglutamate synthase-like GNAT family acetyltransferase